MPSVRFRGQEAAQPSCSKVQAVDFPKLERDARTKAWFGRRYRKLGFQRDGGSDAACLGVSRRNELDISIWELHAHH